MSPVCSPVCRVSLTSRSLSLTHSFIHVVAVEWIVCRAASQCVDMKVVVVVTVAARRLCVVRLLCDARACRVSGCRVSGPPCVFRRWLLGRRARQAGEGGAIRRVRSNARRMRPAASPCSLDINRAMSRTARCCDRHGEPCVDRVRLRAPLALVVGHVFESDASCGVLWTWGIDEDRVGTAQARCRDFTKCAASRSPKSSGGAFHSTSSSLVS